MRQRLTSLIATTTNSGRRAVTVSASSTWAVRFRMSWATLVPAGWSGRIVREKSVLTCWSIICRSPRAVPSPTLVPEPVTSAFGWPSEFPMAKCWQSIFSRKCSTSLNRAKPTGHLKMCEPYSAPSLTHACPKRRLI